MDPERKPRVYVAGPYSTGDVAENVHAAIYVANRLAGMGCAPFCPHLSHFWHMIYHQPWTFWLEQDLQWLACCDALVRLPGPSAGASIEVNQARRLDLPVFALGEDLSLPGDLLRWVEAWRSPEAGKSTEEDNHERSAQ